MNMIRKIKRWLWRRKLDKTWNTECESEFDALTLMGAFDPAWVVEYMEQSPIPFCEFVKDLRNLVHGNFDYKHTVGAWLDARSTLNHMRVIILSCTYGSVDIIENLYPWSRWTKQNPPPIGKDYED
jgi:hypothetical protein